MCACVRRLATLLILANYLLAITAGAWFHRHGPGPCASEGCRAAVAEASHGHGSCDEHDCCHECPLAVGQKHADAVADADECPICQFLAQKLVAARAVEGMVVAVRVERSVIVRSLMLSPVRFALHPIRAPPLVG